MDELFDLAIIGGGINGCGCAADAALRGLSVVLLEQDDLASKTSSSSTKLIHGGLRYLEHYEFGLVKKALDERQILLNRSPYLVRPQAFVLPHQQHMRPAWLLSLGLFLYDHLSHKNLLPHSHAVNRKNNPSYFSPLREDLNRGFLFYDAATDDARLTVLNALQAKNSGASIRTYSKVLKAQAVDHQWQLTIKPATGACYTLNAKTLINAAGPWVEAVAEMTHTTTKHKVTLVKGSHILVKPLYPGKHAYFLQHEDKRMVFVIPYCGLSMIGTTDVAWTSPLIPNQLDINEDELHYLMGLVNGTLKQPIKKEDIVSSWSGIRTLLSTEGASCQSLSRDYSYELSTQKAPVITILGGKITTYRQLSEQVVDELAPFFPQLKSSSTKTTALPGSYRDAMNFDQYKLYAQKKYAWLAPKVLHRYLYSYGTNTEQLLSHCTDMKSLGKHYGESLYQAEVDYLIAEEWVHNSEDLLKRRTKLGYSMSASGQNALRAYLS